MKAAKDMNWALVLSGGGAKGFAHVGVLKALSGMGFPEPSLVVGTSMGAIIGGIYASGMAAEELARIAETRFNITDYLDSFAFKINGPVGRVFQAGQLLGSVVTKPALDPGSKLLALFRELTGDKSFGELKIPFRCNAVDLISGREVVFGEGKVAEAIRASMSFPIFFEPFRTEKMLLVDGGFVDNMPVHIAREMGFRRVLAVDVGAFRTLPASEFVTAPQIVYRCLEISLNSLARSRQ
ncbi:MAG: patatin-like phospholipase family protein, partial [Spirochaetaceae bacterium]|nr:patatin-like phospholipase family protein [Spirochaetaceae bacterium]